MTIRTVHLDAEQLPAFLVRRGFELAVKRDKSPQTTPNGEAIRYAQIVVPGLVPGRFNMEPGLGEVRLRVIGINPEVPAPGLVRLSGKVTITATYNTGQSFRDPTTSAVTISADDVRAVSGERPAGRGFLPAVMPVAATLMDARPQDPNDAAGRWIADVALEAESTYRVEGLAEVLVAGPVRDELLGSPVTFADLRLRWTRPDPQDVSSRTRAELFLSCAELVAVEPASSSSRSRKPDPVPAEA